MTAGSAPPPTPLPGGDAVDHVSSPVRIPVLIADDHRLVREGLRHILDRDPGLMLVGEAENGHEALALIGRNHPRVAVVDLSMPGPSGIALIQRIAQEHPGTAVLVLTMHGEEPYANRSFQAGAKGYLTKDSAADELLAAVHKVARGGVYVSLSMAERLARALQPQHVGPRHALLSDREFEVMRLLVSGLRLTDIARRLHLSVKTISTHKSHIFEKMNLDSTASLVRYALQHGLFADVAVEPAPPPGGDTRTVT